MKKIEYSLVRSGKMVVYRSGGRTVTTPYRKFMGMLERDEDLCAVYTPGLSSKYFRNPIPGPSERKAERREFMKRFDPTLSSRLPSGPSNEWRILCATTKRYKITGGKPVLDKEGNLVVDIKKTREMRRRRH